MSETAYMVYDYPEPPKETGEPCPYCGEEMGVEAYEVEPDVWVCEDCFKDYVKELTSNELADKMSISRRKWV